MASNLLLMLLPFGAKVAGVFLRRLQKEATDGTLPAKLEPHAAVIGEVCTLLLAFLAATAVTPPPAGAPALKIADTESAVA